MKKTVRQKEAATQRMECCWNDCKLKRVKERNVKKENKMKKKWVQTDKPTIAHEMNEWK